MAKNEGAMFPYCRLGWQTSSWACDSWFVV